jgi:hypothetical protein
LAEAAIERAKTVLQRPFGLRKPDWLGPIAIFPQ